MSNSLALTLAVAASLALHAAAAVLLCRAGDGGPPAAQLSAASAVEVGIRYSEPKPALERGAGLPEPEPERHAGAHRPKLHAGAAAAHAPEPAAPVSGAPSENSAEEREQPEAPGDKGTLPVAAPGTEAPEDEAAARGGRAGAFGRAGEGGGGLGTGAGSGLELGAAEDDVAARIARRLADTAGPCYPRALARFRAKGVVHLRFSVGEDGRARDAAVVKSSGVALFDEAALGCVLENAAPMPATRSVLFVPILFRPKGQ